MVVSMTAKKSPEGATSKAVRENVKRLREDQNLTYAELSRRLGDDVGNPIPALGLRRIEAGERKVDTDDLTALAAVLKTSPAYLLLPHAEDADDPVEATGVTGNAQHVWDWIRGDWSIGDSGSIDLDVILRSKPLWSLRRGDDASR